MKNNIIIAGVPRAGKSTVSHILSQEYGYQHVSMDSIIAGFEKCFPETGVSTYQGLSSLDTLRIISSKMAPFVRAMLDSGEYDEFAPGMVLDMYQLLPEDYDKYIRGANCEIVYFITSDVTPEERFLIQKKYDTEKDYTFYKSDEELREGMRSFRGVDRRFDFKLKTENIVFLSDYGHHPKEIEQSVKSIRELYADKKIAAIFQPHLYTRTRDFYQDFANALSLLDEVFLCDIYPAREEPIPGVTSQLIYDRLRPGIEKYLIHKEQILDVVKKGGFDVLISLGAGDIENFVPEITRILKEKA